MAARFIDSLIGLLSTLAIFMTMPHQQQLLRISVGEQIYNVLSVQFVHDARVILSCHCANTIMCNAVSWPLATHFSYRRRKMKMANEQF